MQRRIDLIKREIQALGTEVKNLGLTPAEVKAVSQLHSELSLKVQHYEFERKILAVSSEPQEFEFVNWHTKHKDFHYKKEDFKNAPKDGLNRLAIVLQAMEAGLAASVRIYAGKKLVFSTYFTNRSIRTWYSDATGVFRVKYLDESGQYVEKDVTFDQMRQMFTGDTPEELIRSHQRKWGIPFILPSQKLRVVTKPL